MRQHLVASFYHDRMRQTYYYQKIIPLLFISIFHINAYVHEHYIKPFGNCSKKLYLRFTFPFRALLIHVLIQFIALRRYVAVNFCRSVFSVMASANFNSCLLKNFLKFQYSCFQMQKCSVSRPSIRCGVLISLQRILTVVVTVAAANIVNIRSYISLFIITCNNKKNLYSEEQHNNNKNVIKILYFRTMYI